MAKLRACRSGVEVQCLNNWQWLVFVLHSEAISKRTVPKDHDAVQNNDFSPQGYDPCNVLVEQPFLKQGHGVSTKGEKRCQEPLFGRPEGETLSGTLFLPISEEEKRFLTVSPDTVSRSRKGNNSNERSCVHRSGRRGRAKMPCWWLNNRGFPRTWYLFVPTRIPLSASVILLPLPAV